MNLSLIVAHDKNRGIGKDGKIPWNHPDDLQYFKQITLGQIVVMGRKTWESLPTKPLSNRLNIIFSDSFVFTDMPVDAPIPKGDNIMCLWNGWECLKADRNLAELLPANETDSYFGRLKNKNVYVIGGEATYKQALELPELTKCYVTEIDEEYDCDRFFPALDPKIWQPGTVVDLDYGRRVVYNRVGT